RLIASFEHLPGVDLLVVDVVRDQGPGVLPLCTPMRRRHRKLAIGRLEQRIDRDHRLLQQLADRSTHGGGHRCLLWAAAPWLTSAGWPFTQDLRHRHRPVTQRTDTHLQMKVATAARQQQGRVLVVEDERDVADLIRYNLTKEG